MVSTLGGNDVSTSTTATLLRAVRSLTAHVDGELHGTGLAVDHWLVMDALSVSAGLTMAELQTLTLTAAPTLTRVVDRLVTQALAYREVDQYDRRKVRVYLSDRGVDVHEELHRKISPVEARWTASQGAQLRDRLSPAPEQP